MLDDELLKTAWVPLKRPVSSKPDTPIAADLKPVICTNDPRSRRLRYLRLRGSATVDSSKTGLMPLIEV